MINFNPQGPRGPRPPLLGQSIRLEHFNPQGPRGPRRDDRLCIKSPLYFNPQGPRGPRLISVNIDYDMIAFQSTRPSRASTSMGRRYASLNFISIHKALAGLDKCSNLSKVRIVISIHKALAGLDPSDFFLWVNFRIFQSTRPSRASTVPFWNPCPDVLYFNPQGPRGPRRCFVSCTV